MSRLNRRLNLRNLILFIKDEGSFDVNEMSRRLGISTRTMYRIMREPEYTPNVTLKGFLYIQEHSGIEILEKISNGGELNDD